MGLRFIVGFLLSWGVLGGLFALAERRADYWRPIMERIAKESGNGPIKSLYVTPFKGCGWSLGETIYGEFTVGGVPADFLMCRSREGVRFDLTTYESRWIRGPTPKGDAQTPSADRREQK